MGFNGQGFEVLDGSYFGLQKGFNGQGFEVLNGTYFGLLKGFNGIGFAPTVINVQSVVLNDILGNVNTFAIINASLEDISGNVDSKPLTFLPNVWTAQETGFYFGFDTANIRINFDISGFTFLGNPFNITEVEAVPTINILP